MKRKTTTALRLLVLIMLSIPTPLYSQKKASIEPAAIVKAAPGLIVKQGYLVVPENRKKQNGKVIKIPFVFVRRPEQSATRNVFLYTTGGPGYSSIGNLDSIKADFGMLNLGAFILFDQRGTRRAKPALDCPEVNEAIKRSYIENLSRDSLVQLAVQQCRNRFVATGIDLSAYNTTESAADINDLRIALQIDSLHLLGVSYSGGLMLTVARNHPEGIQSLILQSPLPVFTNYEEQALFNINEALEQVFTNVDNDTAYEGKYKGLRKKFHDYFTGLENKKFTLYYKPKEKQDSVLVYYGKHELLDMIVDRLNTRQVNTVPGVITDIINGEHKKYLPAQLDQYFAGDLNYTAGMRYSIFCSEQVNWSDELLEKQQAKILPWLKDFRYNNVTHAICSCWNVKKEPALVKTPVYSNIPVLIAAGDIDPWCSLFYNRLIKRTMPNTQILIRRHAGHAPGFVIDGTDYLKMFLANPYRQITGVSASVRVE
ncbi:MAG: alpha/beta hydrolase [Chitinophagaceae bacterium]